MNNIIKLSFVFLFCLKVFVSCKADIGDRIDIPINKMNIAKLKQARRPRTYLLSYPRSGNTWLRYCLEFLTKRPTIWLWINGFGEKPRYDYPLGYTFDLAIDANKPCIWKVHCQAQMKAAGKFNSQKEILILIIRNFKEALIRQLGKSAIEQILTGKMTNRDYPPSVYFDNLKLYDQWNPNNRFLVYYEDLIANPKDCFEKIVSFLGEDPIYIDQFLAMYDVHKKNAIAVYGGSHTQGKYAIWHSEKISPDTRKKMDDIIAKKYPYLWETYLKERYSEEILYAKKMYKI